ncbi:MAG: SDR family oxidoreductase [Anaerolineales bacterium]|nr:SDR family oxidoreductase [Anaerolineales bacterium]
MRILITGGAGFIGSHLCDAYLAQGHGVIAVDNLLTGSARNIEHLRGHAGFEFRQQDVTTPLNVDGPLEAVLHFASPASPSLTAPTSYMQLPIETLRVGSLGTFNALDLAKAKGARLLMASTSEVYGDPLEHPQKETYWGHVDSIGPRSVYDEAKRFSEALTMAYHRKHGVATRIVRIFNTYGPRMQLDDGRVVPNFVGQALRGQPLTVYGDGSQTRSFCYVADLVEGLQKLLASDEPTPVNLGNPREVTIREFAEVINGLTGNQGGIVVMPASRTQGDPQRRQPDISKAKRVLGWEPRTPLEAGLRRTIEYFRGVIA